MKNLDDRINNLIATAKSWQIINFKDHLPNGSTIDITSKYNIKLNSNSYVLFNQVKDEIDDTYSNSNVTKGNFTLNLNINTQFIRRNGNSIQIGCQRNGGRYITGNIIILN